MLATSGVHAEETLVAVASNFAAALDQVIAGFEDRFPHKVRVATGSTGKIYAQIVNGAPYDVFLAADRARPERLAESGHGIGESRFTYANGALCLWSTRRFDLASKKAKVFDEPLQRIAIANPALAPYGMAARQYLQAVGHWEKLESRIVRGENIGQTFALVATGNVDLGFVSLGQLIERGVDGRNRWCVPDDTYSPIEQQAILLKHGQANPAATAFILYLRTPTAKAIIRAAGYRID